MPQQNNTPQECTAIKCIAIDLGGSFVKAGICSVGKDCYGAVTQVKITNRTFQPTEKSGPDKLLHQLCKIITELIFSHRNVSMPHHISLVQEDALICIGVPGVINRKNGRLTAGNLSLKNYALAAKLKSLLTKKFKKHNFRHKFRIIIENDTKLFALAEAMIGAGKKYRTILGITLGTGLGSGIIINKQIYLGRGNAGEIGHGTINFDAGNSNTHYDMRYAYYGKCYADRKGRYVNGEIEEFISDRGIIKTAAENGLNCSSAEKVYKLALKKNLAALKAFEQTGTHLGYALLNAANTLDPDIIILGGGISNAWKLMKKSCMAVLKKAAVGTAVGSRVLVIKSSLKDAGLLGAAIIGTGHGAYI